MVIHNSRMSKPIAWQISISFYLTPLIGLKIKAVEVIETTIAIIPSKNIYRLLVQHTGMVGSSSWLTPSSVLSCASWGCAELTPFIFPNIIFVNVIVVDSMFLLISSEEV